MSYLTVLLQGCYQVLEVCNKHILKPFISSVRSHEPPYRADADVDSTDATARRCCGVGVRVSAPLRRGAAPYADGSLRSQPPSCLISLFILSDARAGTRGDLRKILCTSVWHPCITLHHLCFS